MMQYRQGGRAGENHQIYQIRLDLYNTLDLLIFRGKVRLSRGASPSCSLPVAPTHRETALVRCPDPPRSGPSRSGGQQSAPVGAVTGSVSPRAQ